MLPPPQKPPQPSLGGVTKHRKGCRVSPPPLWGCWVSPQPLLTPTLVRGRSQPLPGGVCPAPCQGPSQGARVQWQFRSMVSKGGEYFYSVSHRSSGKTIVGGGREGGRRGGTHPPRERPGPSPMASQPGRTPASAPGASLTRRDVELGIGEATPSSRNKALASRPRWRGRAPRKPPRSPPDPGGGQ